MTLNRKRFGSSGGELAYVSEGDGPALLLLHGYPTSAHLWRDFVPILAPRFRVIAPDLLGYGESEKLTDAGLDIRAQAGYMRELLDELRVGELAIVGHDIGGGVAQLLAFQRDVRTLVLIDSISFDSWPIEGVTMIQEVSDDQVDEVFAENLVRATFDIGMGHRDRLTDDDLEGFIRPWREEPLALVRAARGIDGEGLLGSAPRLASLECPALIVWGEEDPYQTADLAERLGDALPGSTVALLPGCSHFVTEDAPETVLPMISEFLRLRYLGESHRHGPEPVELGVSFDRPKEPDA